MPDPSTLGAGRDHPPTPEGEESMGSNADVAWRYFELQGQGRMEEALELLHDGGTFWNVRTRQWTATPDMKEYIRKVFDKVPMRFTLHNAMDAGDKAILELESHAVRTDGNIYNNQYCFVITVYDGKILHLREYLDTRAAQEMIDFLSA
jgi:ketosteroid isomerase-like protein